LSRSEFQARAPAGAQHTHPEAGRGGAGQ
jgi:hypothetical protein